MASKQIVVDLDRRLAGAVSLMAEDDYRSIPQQIAWLIFREAVRRNLLESVAGDTRCSVDVEQKHQETATLSG